MRGFNTKKAQSCKDGGLIRGPGTGTSDSIPRGFKPGTFIMPADSTKAIGPDVLENVAKVPTKVSNGEFAHTPEQVHAVGINALRMMKDATHSPKEDGVYFANGGTVRGRSAKGFAIGGEVTNDVTRVGNSYSGGNVGGDITVNGQQPGGSFSSASPVNPVIPSAPTSAPVAPTATPALSTLAAQQKPAVPAATPSIQPAAKPVDAFTARNNAVSASSITTGGRRFDQSVQPGASPVAPDMPIPPRREPVGFDPVQAAQRFAGGGAVRGFSPQHLVDGDVVFGSRGLNQLRNTIPKMQAMGYPQNPAQPPAFSPPAQRQPASFGDAAAALRDPGVTQVGTAPTDEKMWRTKAVVQGAADDAKQAWNNGNTSAAVGAATRGLITAGPTMFAEGAYNTVAPLASAAKGFVSGLTGGDTTAQQPSILPAAPATPTDLTPTPGVQTDVQRGGANMPAPDVAPTPLSQQAAQATAPASTAAQALSQVPSLAPVQAQGFSAPQIHATKGSWQTENDLRNARVSASSITNDGGVWDKHKGISPARAAYAQALATDAALQNDQAIGQQQAMAQQQANARTAMQQTGDNQRASLSAQGFATRDQRQAGVDNRKLAMQEAESGFKTRAQAQLENLRNTLLDPNATTEQRRIAQRSLAALSGKTAADRMQTVALPDTTTDTGQVVRGGQALVRTLEDGTVEQVPIGRQGKGGAAPYADGQRLQGKDGKSYVVKNGVPVLQ